MRAILCWGAHAPTRARDDALVIALFVIGITTSSKFISEGRRNQHARRVRSPERYNERLDEYGIEYGT
jgi:hypothetical protein